MSDTGAHPKPGDLVKVEKGEREFSGTLMPKRENSDALILKLDSGYNVGLDPKGAKVSVLKKGEEKPKRAQDGPAAHTGAATERGEVSILGCGGTISSKIEYKTGAVYPIINPKELTMAFPEIEKLAKVNVRGVFSLLSEDMAHGHWKKIAEEAHAELKDGKAEGVVLMHGTDTMHYTASALSFMLRDLPGPVVLVGAQRSSDRPSSDNKLNILNSIFAARGDAAEVGVCMHEGTDDDTALLHRGTRVRKMHTSRRDAFRSINSAPLMRLDYRSNYREALSEYRKRDPKRKPVLDAAMNDNVAMVCVHPGIKNGLISKLGDYDGVVLVGTGLGHVPTNPFNDKYAHSILKEVKGLMDSGIPVVMATQTIYGRVNMNIYTTGRVLREAGVIGHLMDWTPETAFVKLCWVLGHEKNMEKVKEMMETDMVGEISGRSVLDSQGVPE
ncbi:MAG: Glu-tRNA(Gln) amidotransferase subunit GatD [Candidatus Bilamarchaeaceae archaeon]